MNIVEMEVEDQESLIDRYLKNRLGDDEIAEFETLLLENKTLFENVQIAAAFQRAIKREQNLLLSPSSSNSRDGFSFREWFALPQSMASACLMLCLLAFTLVPQDNSTNTDSSQNFFVGSFTMLENTRGQQRQIEISGAGPHLIQIDVGLMPVSSLFSVKLFQAIDGEMIFGEDEISADGEGWLRLLLNEELSGEHSLELSWLESDQGSQNAIYKVNFGAQ